MMIAGTAVVLLATSWAPLLSGQLHQCIDADDPSCNGGVAAFRAMLRHHASQEVDSSSNATSLTTTMIQLLDKDNAFVHMHPLGLSVNRLILNGLMNLDVFASSPSILLQNKHDAYKVSSQDISYLQTEEMPLLLSNVCVPPLNSWHPYTKSVHFDTETRLAILSLSMSSETMNAPQVESALGSLRYIRKVNEENGCVLVGGSDVVGAGEESSHETSMLFSHYFENDYSSNATTKDEEQQTANEDPLTNCWIPVVYHSDDTDKFVSFLQGMLELPKHYRPALLIDTEGNFPEYSQPTLVNNSDIWVSSTPMNTRSYFQHKLSISRHYHRRDNDDGMMFYGLQLDNVTLITEPLHPLSEEIKDTTYRKEILALRKVADEALQNNPIVGYSDEMPFARDGGSIRPCKAGECPIGNLYTDAARWYADADLAFITSGGVRGPGWPAGEVKVSNIWSALPYPNNLCTGVMNGIHLFQLLNYSMSVATFEGENTDDGGRLLQISGLKITYNTQLSPSRIISIDVLDRGSGLYQPIDRLKLYKFATDSYLCGGYKPFVSLLGDDNLVVEGEQPGRIIEGVLYQEMLAEFLNATTTKTEPYDTTIQNRLNNDTSATEVLNLIQSEESCAPGEFWEADIETCSSCPVNVDVTFSTELIEFETSDQDRIESITLTNNEEFDVAIIPKRLPDWLVLESIQSVYAGSNSLTHLGAGESLKFSMSIEPSELEAGTIYVTVAFGVLDGGDYHGCVGADASFDVTMKVLPAEQMNQLGSIRIAGLTLFGIIAITSISFAGFVFCNRHQPVVKALQPIFLLFICGGVLVMGSSIVPLSFDDGIASQRGSDIACMSLPWLLTLGFSVAISALFAKLWRINKLFSASNSFRRVQVRVQDVLMPLVALLAVNISVLLCWTLIDPLVYERYEIDGASWSSYGRCVGTSNAPNTFLIILSVLNIIALLLALIQAWKARKISDEFSETKIVGGALYGWLQLLIIGVPVLALIEEDNTTARYFLLVALLFLVSMSMLLIIFVPLFVQIRNAQMQQKVRATGSQQIGSQQIDSQFSSSSRFNSSSKVLISLRGRLRGSDGRDGSNDDVTDASPMKAECRDDAHAGLSYGAKIGSSRKRSLSDSNIPLSL